MNLPLELVPYASLDQHNERAKFQEKVKLAKERALLKFIESCEMARIRKAVQDNDYTNYPVLLEYKNDLSRAASTKIHPVHFVTIRPDEKAWTFPDFFKAVQKFAKSKSLHGIEYVFEQHGTDLDLGSGFHVHALVWNTKYPTAWWKQQLTTRFPMSMQSVQPIFSSVLERFVQDKREYMRGKKTGLCKDGITPKSEIVEGDAIWRDLNKIEPYYTHGSCSPFTSDPCLPASSDSPDQEEDAHDSRSSSPSPDWTFAPPVRPDSSLL